MTITLLKKEHTRMRVKEVQLSAGTSPILGDGIDVTTLPEGHLSCIHCKGHLFECWVYLDNHRLEMGCMGCGHSYRLLFPMDVSLGGEGRFRNQGRFACKRHPGKGFVLIHNVDVISVGCEKCFTEVQIPIRTHSNLIVADA